jgi:murein DD-endopeptidase MepM/ murein hydrolase activator NlpD
MKKNITFIRTEIPNYSNPITDFDRDIKFVSLEDSRGGIERIADELGSFPGLQAEQFILNETEVQSRVANVEFETQLSYGPLATQFETWRSPALDTHILAIVSEVVSGGHGVGAYISQGDAASVNGNGIATDGPDPTVSKLPLGTIDSGQGSMTGQNSATQSPLLATDFRHPLGSGWLDGDGGSANVFFQGHYEGDWVGHDGLTHHGFQITDHYNIPRTVSGVTVYHMGEDWNGSPIGNEDLGVPVKAMANGIVIGVANDSGFHGGIGNYVLIRHQRIDGTYVTSGYGHLNNANVLIGQEVNIGDTIGTIGSTGNSSGPHLHFMVFIGVTTSFPLDPTSADQDVLFSGYVDPSIFINTNRLTSAPTTYSLTPDATTVVEGNTSVTFIVNRSGGLSAESLYYSTIPDTASAGGNDYVGLSNVALNFVQGQSTATFTVTIKDDIIFEPTEHFSVVLTRNPGDVTNLDASDFYIIDNDSAPAAPVVSIFATSADKAEGNSGTTAFTFTVTRSGDVSGSSSVNWNINSTSFPTIDPSDISGALLGTVSFAAGETSKVITVNVIGDTIYESSGLAEVFTVGLSNAAGASIGSALATGQIQNDDALFTELADVVTLPVGGGTYYALGGDDVVTGSSAADVVFGGLGNDRMVGGLGDDTLFGGDGSDTASFSDALSGVTVSLAIAASQNIGGGLGFDTLSEIENLIGSNWKDTLIGDAGVNSLDGGDGVDTLVGGAGADSLNGGDGSDYVQYYLSAAAVTINLTAGTGSGGDAQGDVISGVENIYGSNLEGDTLIGDGNANLIYGFGGNDILLGGAGADSLYGGDGSDYVYYYYSGSAVTVNLAAGTGSGGDAQSDVISGVENIFGSNYAGDTLIGDGNANFIFGVNGNDLILSGVGNDILYGGNGTDTLIGNAGTDFFYGGADTDYFHLGYDVKAGDADYLLDFTHGSDYVLLAKSYQGHV